MVVLEEKLVTLRAEEKNLERDVQQFRDVVSALKAQKDKLV